VTRQGREIIPPEHAASTLLRVHGVSRRHAIVHDARLGLWRWSVLIGRPEMLRIGDADSEHKADVQVRAVIDRALALEEMVRGRDRS
jgi:hypothetical protein